MRMLALVLLWAAWLPAQEPGVLRLAAGWRIQSSAKVSQAGAVISKAGFQPAGWHAATVPTTVLAALVDNKIYPDPYYGLNLKKIPGYREGRWLVMPANTPFRDPWWYRTEFTLPESYRGKHLTLHLDGINYQANIWLNGGRVADSKTVIGMFRRFEFPVNEYALVGQRNCLAVEIIPPGLLPDKPYDTKQIEATTGWDDHNPQPPDANMGIWRHLYIRATGPVVVKHPYVAVRLDLPSLQAAHLTVSAELFNLSDRAVEGELRGEIEAIRFAQAVRLAPKRSRVVKFIPENFAQLNIPTCNRSLA